MPLRVLVGVVAVATLVASGCASNGAAQSAATPTSGHQNASPEPSVGAEITVGGITATYHGTADVSGSSKITLRLGDNYFEPTVIRGKPGQQLVLTLENTSQDSHTFTTADGVADIEVQPGSIAEGKITLPASGNLAFFCETHKDKGMAGVFNVSGPLADPGPSAGTPSR